MQRLTAVLAVLVCAATAATAARAYVLERERSGPRTITYYNEARQHSWAIDQALRAWNESGAQVEFTPTAREEAELIIRYLPGPPVLTGETTRIERGGGLGAGPGDSVVSIPRWDDPSQAQANRFVVVLIAAHELGHVVGLGHEDSGCALMNSVIEEKAPSACSQPPSGMWRCRLVEEDDVKGAVALYGGEPRRPGPEFCPVTQQSRGRQRGLPPPEYVSVIVDPTVSDQAELRWRNVRDPALRGVAVARAEGRCPSRPVGAAARRLSATHGTPGLARFPLEPGRYCYALWSRDAAGQLSRKPTQVWARPLPTPQPPGRVTATVGIGPVVALGPTFVRWRNPADHTVRAIVIAYADGDCPLTPPATLDSWQQRAATPGAPDGTVDFSLPLGRDGVRCYALWSQDGFGRWSRPTTARARPAGPG